MPWREWRRLWEAADKFASKDPTLPTLCGVRVWREPGKLMAFATDRFRAVRLTIPAGSRCVADSLPPVDAFLAQIPLAYKAGKKFHGPYASR